jgi:hypothetical protein
VSDNTRNQEAFVSALTDWLGLVESRVQRTFTESATELRRSVVEGSELTGAPGQPVVTGNLRKSWIGEFEGSKFQLSTNVEYAPLIEDGGSDLIRYNPERTPPRSAVGGYHSVKTTIMAWPRVAEIVAERVAAETESALGRAMAVRPAVAD